MPDDPAWSHAPSGAEENSVDEASATRTPELWDRDWREVDPLGYYVSLSDKERVYPALPRVEETAATHANPGPRASSGGAAGFFVDFLPATEWWFRAVAVSAGCLTLLGIVLLTTSILKFRKFRTELLLSSSRL